jgi:hypothetical protein
MTPGSDGISTELPKEFEEKLKDLPREKREEIEKAYAKELFDAIIGALANGGSFSPEEIFQKVMAQVSGELIG